MHSSGFIYQTGARLAVTLIYREVNEEIPTVTGVYLPLIANEPSTPCSYLLEKIFAKILPASVSCDCDRGPLIADVVPRRQ